MGSLREKLDHIVNGGEYTVREHVALINQLRREHNHSIQNVPDNEPVPYNCFQYALGVVESQPVIDILKEDAQRECNHGIKFGADFIEWLISNGVLKNDNKGRIVVYFYNEKPVHAGKIEDSRVISKWGIGLLWEHDIWEVPSSYGNEYRRFVEADSAIIEQEFQKYCIEKGHPRVDLVGISASDCLFGNYPQFLNPSG